MSVSNQVVSVCQLTVDDPVRYEVVQVEKYREEHRGNRTHEPEESGRGGGGGGGGLGTLGALANTRAHICERTRATACEPAPTHTHAHTRATAREPAPTHTHAHTRSHTHTHAHTRSHTLTHAHTHAYTRSHTLTGRAQARRRTVAAGCARRKAAELLAPGESRYPAW